MALKDAFIAHNSGLCAPDLLCLLLLLRFDADLPMSKKEKESVIKCVECVLMTAGLSSLTWPESDWLASGAR